MATILGVCVGLMCLAFRIRPSIGMFSNTGVTSSVDPCGIAQPLFDGHLRSTGYVIKNHDFDSMICDRTLLRGWYYFSSGTNALKNQMPETCPAIYHCGTHVPIWLHGAHPSLADGIVTMETCGHTTTGCCGITDHIRVKNCGTFYVYELVPTRGCSAAYCAGTGVPCPPDMASPTGFMPGCIQAYPKITQNPQLSPPIVRPDTFVFNCHIPFDPSRTDVGFQVTWLFDGKPNRTMNVTHVTGSDRDAEMDQKYLVGHLGQEVSCSIKSYFLKSPGRKGPPVTSNPYWAGIKLSKPRLEVGENEKPQTVQIISTIPIVCNATSQAACRFEMYLKPDSGDILQTQKCTQVLKSSDWNPVTHQAVTSFQVLAKRDYKKDGDKNLVMRFDRIVTYDGPPLFNNATLPYLQIMTKDKETSSCDCYGDPHCRTMDQTLAKGPRYNYYKVGEFTMYKSTSREFEVQTRTWHCGKVSCICAVAAREGNDVITVDMCQGPYGKSFPKVRVQHNGVLSPGTVVYRNDPSEREVLIQFPSGAWVKVKAWSASMTVFIHAPEDDFGATQGLCGTFNKQITDDQTGKDGVVHPWNIKPDSFVESWRVPIGTSMFDKETPIDQNKPNRCTTYCNCDNKQSIVDCSINNKAVKPPANSQIPGGNVIASGSPCTATGRRRRSMSATVGIGLASYYFDYGFLWFSMEGTFPTKSGMTQADAYKACNDSFFAEPIIQKCVKQIGIDVRSQLDSCVDDIKQMDSLDFVESAVESLIMNCMEKAITDPVYYDNSTGLPPAFITTDRCPSRCSGNGACMHGTCHCKTGFSGNGCEINTTKPPSLSLIETTDAYVRTSDVCDVTVDSCRKITVIGENIAPSSNLHCRFSELKFDGTRFKPTGHHVTVGVDYSSSHSVACRVPLPPHSHGQAAIGYQIAVTNDGVTYSNNVPGYIVDSTCMSCQANGGQCTIKDNTCLIAGKCYTRGAVSASGDGKCDPDSNTMDWTAFHPTAHSSPEPAKTTASSVVPRPTVPYPSAPIGGTPLVRFDIWTTTQTGCPCGHNKTLTTCACCDDGGCQCPGSHANQCTFCGDTATCGPPMPAPDYGIDGYTLALSDCQCTFDKSKSNCACCREHVNACACGERYRNQCVDCGHMDRCGSKPWIFGPPMPSSYDGLVG